MTRTMGRRILGLIWLIDGILELLPGTAGSFLPMVQQMAAGQPAPIHRLILWGYSVMLPYPIAWNDAVGAAEIAVGVALIIGLWPRLTLAASILLCIPLWIWGEAFGGILTGSATDIGALPLYAFVAVLVWPRRSLAADQTSERPVQEHAPSGAQSRRTPARTPGAAARHSHTAASAISQRLLGHAHTD